MLHSAKNLVGFTIGATDGTIGQIDELYFDDLRWTLRYFVVDTGGWLAGRQVLISPRAVNNTDWANRRVDVNLTRAQVEASPGIDADRPVSRQYEIEYSRYYGYPIYWTGTFLPSFPLGPGAQPPAPEGDPHLRSSSEVIGYDIEANDGDIGHVEDFLCEDQTWVIRYMIIDTRNWWPGTHVLVSPDWIDRIDWHQSKVHVDLSREVIRNSPEYDPSRPLDREFEMRLYETYRRPGYWDRKDVA